MNWFQGSIIEAVAASKAKKAIFVVFIEGKDDPSQNMAKVINSDEISSRLQSDDFVAIQVESGSESFGFFQQIYQLVPIPSIFFIGQNGSPLEVVAGETSVDDLSGRIDALVAKSDPKTINSSTSFIQSEQAASTTAQSMKLEPMSDDSNVTKNIPKIPTTTQSTEQIQSEVTSNVSPSLEVLPSESGASLEKAEMPSTSNTSSDNTVISDILHEEKLERARKLIEQQKKIREDNEAKTEREREIQRRKTGQDMLKMKQKQQELEIKQAHEERMKEKAAEAAARDKVRQQIAQDRLERKQREQQNQQYMQQNSPVQEVPQPRASPSGDSSHARIQFRLPSGTTHMGRFESTSTFGAVRTYVLDNIELPFPEFTLVTTYPRREFFSSDDSKTLLELSLVPSSVLLIMPLRNRNTSSAVTSVPNIGFLSGLLWTVFGSISSMYNSVRGYFFGTPRQSVQTPNSDTGATTGVSSASSTGRPVSRLVDGLQRRNVSGVRNTSVRAQGNVHQLRSGAERDSDENNTWNGNSTQQM